MNVGRLYTCMSAAVTFWITIVRSNYLKILSTKKLEFLKKFQFHTSQHGLRTPHEASFHLNSKLQGLDKQFEQAHSGLFGVFWANLSAPILVLCPKPLYPNPKYSFGIWNLGFEFEFGPKRFRGLAIVCPCFIVCTGKNQLFTQLN